MRRMLTVLAGVALVLGMSGTAWSDHGHRGDRDGRHRHGHHGGYHGGYYGHGPYYGGGYGCNYEYPCSTSAERPSSDCAEYSDNGQVTRDPSCRYSSACDCWYKASEAPKGGEESPGDAGGGGPAPDAAPARRG